MATQFRDIHMHNQQTVLHPDSATKIFVFEEVYPLRAAQEQADKKKLSAFGMFAKFNPLNRPKEETVQLSRQELRWEPFWHIVAKRSVDYSCQLTYQVPVHNPYAQTLQIDDKVFEVARQKDKARIEFVALEHCHRKIQFDQLIDGMQRDIKSSVFCNTSANTSTPKPRRLSGPSCSSHWCRWPLPSRWPVPISPVRR